VKDDGVKTSQKKIRIYQFSFVLTISSIGAAIESKGHPSEITLLGLKCLEGCTYLVRDQKKVSDSIKSAFSFI
jgi:hypothetical protein